MGALLVVVVITPLLMLFLSVKAELSRHKEALAGFDKAINLQSDLAEAWFGRGFAKRHLGRYEEALVDLDEAIRLKPDDVGV